MEKQTYKTERKIILVGKNASVDAILKDLSLNEAGVLTPRGAREGTELELQMELPASGVFKNLSIETTVTHRHNVEDDIYLKLAFTHLTEEQYQAISDFLSYKQRLIDMGKRPQL